MGVCWLAAACYDFALSRCTGFLLCGFQEVRVSLFRGRALSTESWLCSAFLMF